jgi:hypothetical protein
MESFPPLQDVAIYKGRLVYIGKKAQLIVGDLSRRFKVHYPPMKFQTSMDV